MKHILVNERNTVELEQTLSLFTSFLLNKRFIMKHFLVNERNTVELKQTLSLSFQFESPQTSFLLKAGLFEALLGE